MRFGSSENEKNNRHQDYDIDLYRSAAEKSADKESGLSMDVERETTKMCIPLAFFGHAKMKAFPM